MNINRVRHVIRQQALEPVRIFSGAAGHRIALPKLSLLTDVHIEYPQAFRFSVLWTRLVVNGVFWMTSTRGAATHIPVGYARSKGIIEVTIEGREHPELRVEGEDAIVGLNLRATHLTEIEWIFKRPLLEDREINVTLTEVCELMN